MPSQKLTSESSPDALGPRLRTLRERIGITQARCADALGVKVDSYRHIEAGRTSLPAAYVPKLAQILDCSLEDILKAAETKTMPVAAQTQRRREHQQWELYEQAIAASARGDTEAATTLARRVHDSHPAAGLRALSALVMSNVMLIEGLLSDAYSLLTEELSSLPDDDTFRVLRCRLEASLGDILEHEGRLSEAEQRFQTCRVLLQDLVGEEARLETRSLQKRFAQLALFSKDPQQGLALARSAFDQFQESDGTEFVRAEYVLAWACQDEAQRLFELTSVCDERLLLQSRDLAHEAIKRHREAIRFSCRNGDVYGKAKGLFYLGEDFRKLRYILTISEADADKMLRRSQKLTRLAFRILPTRGNGTLRGWMLRGLAKSDQAIAVEFEARGVPSEADRLRKSARIRLSTAIAIDAKVCRGRLPALYLELARLQRDYFDRPGDALQSLDSAWRAAVELGSHLRREIEEELDKTRPLIEGSVLSGVLGGLEERDQPGNESSSVQGSEA